MNFLNPSVLWFVPPVVFVSLVLAFMTFRRYQYVLQLYSEKDLALAFSKPLTSKRYQWSVVCILLAMACLLVATARPYVPDAATQVVRGTTDLVAIVDVSRSMAAEDYKGQLPKEFENGTRLDMARYLMIKELLPAFQGNQLGLVSYAGNAVPQSYLTDDMPSLEWVIANWLTISSAPGDGSAISQSFERAFQLFDLDSLPSQRKVIVLFSDGGNDESAESIDGIVTTLRKKGIELVVVGLGKEIPARIPVKHLSNLDEYVKQLRYSGKEWYEVNGEIVKTSLDAALLRHLANRAGGTYRQIVDESDFNFNSSISPLEATYKTGIKEIYAYPLVVGIVMAAIAILLIRQNSKKLS